MNALRGAIAVLMLQAVSALIPPDNDVVFFSLPVSWRVFFILSLAFLAWGGIAMFFWGVVAIEPWKQNKAVGDPSDNPTDETST